MGILKFNVIHHGDCMELIKDIPNESIDCVIVDPPYGTVKGMKLGNQKEDAYKWDTVLDMDALFKEYFRVLKPKGKVFVFSQNKFTNQVRRYNKYLEYLYPLIWVKDGFANYLAVNKAPVQHFEDISVFEKKYGEMPKSRAYAKKVLEFINLSLSEMRKILGHQKAVHFFQIKTLQFSNLTKQTYDDLINRFKINEMDGFLDYDEWLELYNSERENTRAKTLFSLPEGKNHFSNILEFPRDRPSLHTTQKPVALIEQLIKVYTEKDAVILDNCIGSGTTAVAAMNTGRFYIGMEQDEEYFNIANERVKTNQSLLELVADEIQRND